VTEPAAPEEPLEVARPLASPRRRILPLVLLLGGGLVAAYLASTGPREQHVRLVLGSAAGSVTALAVQYVASDGDVAREARMAWEPARAPRVVALEPELPDGDYRLRIDVDTREGRRSTERRVTLGGGTTQVDLTGVLSHDDHDERKP
jgi:hypothetical protein